MLTRKSFAFTLISLVMIAVVAIAVLGAGKPVAAQTGMTLVFSDEFNGTSIDTSKWQISNFKSVRNNEQNCYTPEDAYLSNGNLVLRQQMRNFTDPSGNTCIYTSGQLISKNYVLTAPGRIEVRGQPVKGQGFHSAYWAFPDSATPPSTDWTWPPEIDVMEVLGHQPNRAYISWHYGVWPQDHQVSTNYTGPDFTVGFHTYVVEYSSTSMIWYIDGVVRNSTTRNLSQTSIPMKVLIDTAIGGNWPGSPDATTPWPGYHYIDYVRVYSGSGSVPTSTNGPTNTPVNTSTGPTNTPTNTPVATATPVSGGTNLALNKACTASSVNNTSTEVCGKALDGSLTTYWRTLKRSSLPSEWITVDLGSSTTVSRVELEWGISNYATVYTVQVSQDGTNWTTVATVTGGNGNNDVVSFAPVAARYVKLDTTAWTSNTERNWLYEFEIYQ